MKRVFLLELSEELSLKSGIPKSSTVYSSDCVRGLLYDFVNHQCEGGDTALHLAVRDKQCAFV